MKKLLIFGFIVMSATLVSAANYRIDVYKTYSNPSTDGSPYSDYVDSIWKPWQYFTEEWGQWYATLPTGIEDDNNWHPFGLQSFGAVITGYFSAPQDGWYNQFWTQSDDGSRMFIDGNLVVDNGGPHGPQWAPGGTGASVYLTAGVHKMTLNFYEDFGGASMLEGWINGGLTPVNCPDAGTNLALLGMAMSGLGLIRRKLI